MSFNLLNKTLVTPLDSAAEAARLLLEVVTPDNSYAIVAISESLGLGIEGEIKAKSEAAAMAQMESEEEVMLDPNA